MPLGAIVAGLPAVIGCDHEWRHTEHLGSSESVNVIATAVGFHQERVIGKMCQQAQLDLRIIGGEKQVSGLDREGGANFTA